MENVKASAPWVSYYHKLNALFAEDPDVKVEYIDETPRVLLKVKSADKASALSALLPKCVEFGNVKLFVSVRPDRTDMGLAELFYKAFAGNPLFEDVLEIRPEGSSNPFTYVMFAPEVVQYWDDNLGDPHGNVSALAQDIAREVMKDTGAYYCTAPLE